MSKFNRAAVATRPAIPTFEGGTGFARDPRQDLFLLAVTNMAGEDSFYESAGQRDQRFRDLVHTVALEDAEWLARFVGWLRGEANMRSASVVAACEAVWARLQVGLHGGNRQLIDLACRRADEPGEVLAYWTSRYGRALPKPVKRGVADAVARLYSEYSLAKYDGDSRGYRFADVIDLVHPAGDPAKPWQGDLFRHALDRRHARGNPVPESLRMLRARAELLDLPLEQRRDALLDAEGPARLAAAGLTWEALAGWLQGPMDHRAWEAVIPSMGLMALARNLRNFDQAAICEEAAASVAARFRDPEQVARSRMFPYRWLSAYRASDAKRWGGTLDAALAASFAGVPELPGRTLVLVDTSGSMQGAVSARSQVRHVDVGALIGVAIAGRGCEVDLIGFADGTFRHEPAHRGRALAAIERFTRRVGEVGHGTRMVDALAAHYTGQDRVVVVSDMQTFPYLYHPQMSADDVVPADVPIFGINTSGYAPAALPPDRRNRFEVGGFSDKVFTMFGLLASEQDAAWPF